MPITNTDRQPVEYYQAADSGRPRKLSAIPILFVMITSAICLFIFTQVRQSTIEAPTRTPKVFVFPEGFSGKARVYYGLEGEQPLPLVKDPESGTEKYQLLFPASGEIRTSTPMEWGRAVDQFFLLVRKDNGTVVRRQVNYSGADVHKTGLLGDENEFFYSEEELALRDPKFVELYEQRRDELQKTITENGFQNIDHPAYELIFLKSGIF